MDSVVVDHTGHLVETLGPLASMLRWAGQEDASGHFDLATTVAVDLLEHLVSSVSTRPVLVDSTGTALTPSLLRCPGLARSLYPIRSVVYDLSAVAVEQHAPGVIGALLALLRAVPHDLGPEGRIRDAAVEGSHDPLAAELAEPTGWERSVRACQVQLLAGWPTTPGSPWVLEDEILSAHGTLCALLNVPSNTPASLVSEGGSEHTSDEGA